MTRRIRVYKMRQRHFDGNGHFSFEGFDLMSEHTVDRQSHTGDKYLRTLTATRGDKPGSTIQADVYDVIVGYDVRCPARQHAIKKLLCAGLRGKGSQVQDLIEARDAVSRAIELQQAAECVVGDGSDQPLGVLNRRPGSKTDDTPHWEAVPVGDDGVVRDTSQAIGWKVRWSAPNEKGEFLWVRHYFAGDDATGPTLGWCQNAAEGDAKRMNDSGALPPRYAGGADHIKPGKADKT